MLVWFVKPIERIVIKMVSSKGEIDKEYHLEYINTGLMGTPELSLHEASKEVAKFGHLTHRMLGFFIDLFQSKESKRITKRLAKIQKYENITDRVEVEIADYLLKVSSGELTANSSLRVRSMLSIINDLERIADNIYLMSKYMEKKVEDRTWFTPEQRENLNNLLTVLEEAIIEMLKNLNMEYGKANIEKSRAIHDKMNKLKWEIRAAHLQSIERGDYNMKSGLVYADLYTACEKTSDIVMNVMEAVVGKV